MAPDSPAAASRRGLAVPDEFHSFGPSHIAAMAAMLAVSVVLIVLSRARRSEAFDKRLRRTLAFLLIADWAAYLAFFYAKGWLALGNVLPLNLCDWATVAVAVALLKPGRTAYELSYFWALAGTLLASVTPDLRYDFPDWRFLFFFFYHAIIITSVLYLTFGLRLKPEKGAVGRVAAWTLLYIAVAGAADWLLGTNYGFLRAKPQVATLFDRMPPWPWYIAESFLIGLAAMVLLYAPFYLIRIRTLRTRDAG
jgi:hypothetical integral membrane protein (TIGR02206 family)